MPYTKLLDYSHLDIPCPDGSTQDREYPSRQSGVAYFRKRFAYLLKEGMILDKVTGQEYSQARFVKEAFNAWYYETTQERKQPDGSVKTVTTRHPIVKEYIADPNRQYFEKKVYVPGKHQEEVPKCWNTWPGWPYEPKEGDIGLWSALLDHLFEGLPYWEREWFEHWIAFQIQNPGQKVFSAVLMSGASGIGKGTVLRVLEALFGANTHGITEHELTSRFTASVIDSQLCIADEIGIKGADKHQVARRLKGWITEPKMSVELKFRDVVEVENKVNWIFATNDPNPLVQDDDDRRYFDLRFPQTVKIDSTGTGLVEDFVRWFGPPNDISTAQVEARRAMMHYFLHLDISRLKSEDAPIERFDPHSSTPVTVSKASFIELSSSESINWLRLLRDHPDDALSFRGKILSNVLLSTDDLWTLFRHFNGEETKKKSFEQELIRCGFFRKAYAGSGGRVRTATGTKTLWVVRPDRFDEMKFDAAQTEPIRALYNSEYPEIAEFISDPANDTYSNRRNYSE